MWRLAQQRSEVPDTGFGAIQWTTDIHLGHTASVHMAINRHIGAWRALVRSVARNLTGSLTRSLNNFLHFGFRWTDFHHVHILNLWLTRRHGRKCLRGRKVWWWCPVMNVRRLGWWGMKHERHILICAKNRRWGGRESRGWRVQIIETP